MSTPTADDASLHGVSVPPPGCPAHGGTASFSQEGLARVYVGEHQTNPMELYERLRAEHGAVAPVLVDGDLPAWLVLGYQENLDVVRSPNRFSRDSRLWRPLQEGAVAPDSPLLPMVGWQPVCAFVDGEEHERLRGAVTDSLGKIDRRGIRRHVTRFANQLIDSFCADGEVDLMARFAEPLPMLVMTQLFGMPDEYGPNLVDASLDLIRGTGTAFESNEYVMAAITEHVARVREQPGIDFASGLMAHAANLTDAEIIQHLRVVMAAAHHNTTVLIGNTLRVVVTDPRFRASLAGARMTLPDALEQVLWDQPSTIVCPGRWSTGDTELAGQTIKAGDMLLLGLAAGNVDPEIRPDLTVPMHGNRSHLAFSSGPHECPGQDIGRAITDTAIDVLLGRLPELNLAVDDHSLTWEASWMSRQLTALPVTFAPRPPLGTEGTGEIPTAKAPAPAVSAERATAAAAPVGAAREAGAADGAPAAPAPEPVPAAAPPAGGTSFLGRVAGWFGMRRK
ncbi:cytochrome P450 [Yinghuangia sp. ASG 101]|uniref:cytochrome P450 n=1 Tax=Yinghuangia sp. ASG 101 TaxID=2896848 RepID=UPI001E54717C|nr:cytochrome P450 [Yinghuangia sp. ASG 101]UGQ13155.1 cytochrome P450 [Yinghuangia sp. ASG 101]